MAQNRTHRLLLEAAATDRTFALVTRDGRRWLEGKCIHCGRRLAIAVDGSVRSTATVEHIVPRTHGGTDALENLAVACARCNNTKGVRHDSKPWGDPALQALVEKLQTRRRERLRPRLEGLD